MFSAHVIESNHGVCVDVLQAEQLWEPLGALDNLPGLQKDMQQLAKQYAPLPERANLDSGWYDGSLRIDKLVKSVQSRLPVALLGDAKVKGFTDKLFVSTRAVWNIYGKPASALMGHAGQQASAAAGSAPESAAVSQGGVTEGGMSGPAHDEDEPISDDEDTV